MSITSRSLVCYCKGSCPRVVVVADHISTALNAKADFSNIKTLPFLLPFTCLNTRLRMETMKLSIMILAVYFATAGVESAGMYVACIKLTVRVMTYRFNAFTIKLVPSASFH